MKKYLFLLFFIGLTGFSQETAEFIIPTEKGDIECVVLTEEGFKQLINRVESLEDEAKRKPEIEGLHPCYLTDSVDDIIGNKKVTNHNIAIETINEHFNIRMRKGGTEPQKVKRITDYLKSIGFRE